MNGTEDVLAIEPAINDRLSETTEAVPLPDKYSTVSSLKNDLWRRNDPDPLRARNTIH